MKRRLREEVISQGNGEACIGKERRQRVELCNVELGSQEE